MNGTPAVQSIPQNRLGESRQKESIIGIYVAIAISSLIVFVRIYARAILIRQFGWDDVVITFAMILSWALLPLLVLVILNGGGRHLMAVLSDDPAGLDKMTLWVILSTSIYVVNIVVCRISGILFYARLNSMPRFVLYLRFTFIFVIAAFVVQVVVTTIRCVPLSAMWQEEHGKRCYGVVTMTYNTVLTVTADILILLLPTNVIFSMKATLERKVVLGIILSFGLLASIGRIVVVFKAVDHLDDITWYISVVMIWTSAEVSTAIVALSLPALKGMCGSLQARSFEIEQSDSQHDNNFPLGPVGSQTRHEAPTGSDSHCKGVSSLSRENTSQERLWP
ncbi:hypothetical protein P170DRAFT_356798 [Aspergillus steynii IBT 23096]|uniref:Rhodopsin domain-containing protein n=1 Tax=Aspergillus steynii IBT 23096 TaxID=1392250 RepID=A0A2I2G6X2_9EURO|nr:uncharacterized protein P170DRAFT_356798 [Aspergillus steynii IBT 23096]PLB48623.1 hypothetical protein P170DRAFT_356798 [Aspergillus steynii IBT 23096]